jgi:cytochrome c553
MGEGARAAGADMKLAVVWLAACLGFAASEAEGQGTGSSPGAASAPAGSVSSPAALGAVLATQGGPGIAPCASCHGAAGEGQAAAGFPRLAGQPAPYLQRQLQAYAEGFRTNPVMQPIAQAMTPAQRSAAAAHYASLGSASGRTASAKPPASPPLGRTLATVGAQDRPVQACANCHGPEGIGEWATYPALAGQHASYLKSALAAWRDGTRRTDASEQMPRIARLLTEAETEAVIAYYAALPPPGPARTENASRRGAQTIVSGPTAQGRTATTQGVGTEQGAPLSGGTQGVGGPGNPTGPQSGAPASATAPAAARAPRRP